MGNKEIRIMPKEVDHSGGQILGGVSAASKNFYSAGASFTTFGCAGVTFSMWRALEQISPTFKADWCGFLLSALIVLAYALVVPEPNGYPNAGKMRLTLAEFIFGFFNAGIIFMMILGYRAPWP
jgi:hypothetical protein